MDERLAKQPIPLLALDSEQPVPASWLAAPNRFQPPRSQHLAARFDSSLWACPRCRAPLSVRGWLMTADCWRCDCSLDLLEVCTSPAKRRTVRRTATKGAAAPGLSRPVGVATVTATQQTTAATATAKRAAREGGDRARGHSQVTSRVTAPPIRRVVPPFFCQPAAALQPTATTFATSVRTRVSSLPAWLISLLMHLSLRVQLVHQEGGTTMTEAAAARGLRWVALWRMGFHSEVLVHVRHALQQER